MSKLIPSTMHLPFPGHRPILAMPGRTLFAHVTDSGDLLSGYRNQWLVGCKSQKSSLEERFEKAYSLTGCECTSTRHL